MVRPIVAVALALVIVAVAGGAVWYSSLIPQATDWCEKGEPTDKPSIVIRNPETLTPETASVRMVGDTLFIDTVGDYVAEGRMADVRFEMRNAGLGHVLGATLVRSPEAGWAYKIVYGGNYGNAAYPIDMCAGFSFEVFFEIYDNTPGTIQLMDEDGVFIGPQIQVA